MSGVEVRHPRCPFCHEDVTPADTKAACDACMSWHHADCWTESGRCGTCRSKSQLRQRAPTQQDSAPLVIDVGRNLRCPRCHLDLRATRYEGSFALSCQQCLGYWFRQPALMHVIETREVLFSDEERRLARGDIAYRVGLGSRGPPGPCVECEVELRYWEVWPGLFVYRCPDHGVWLDTGDLKRLQVLAEETPALHDLFQRGAGYCPRCRLPLVKGSYEGAPAWGCSQCLGYWMGRYALLHVLETREEKFSVPERQQVHRQVLSGRRAEREVLPCVACAGDMKGWFVKPTVPVFRCDDHGVWLETGDLKRLQILAEDDPTVMGLMRSVLEG